VSKAGDALADRILSELAELSSLTDRVRRAWETVVSRNDDFYLDSVALNLHGFYSGLERIFERIASSIDGNVPAGANWHQELLEQMSREIQGVRPAVISPDLKDKLEGYRGFRHVVRHVYSYHLNPAKIKSLVELFPETLKETDAALTAFAEFLRNAA
jgi:uncharacterized protein YutE (UPF0331/DUF86 family)